MRVDDYGMSLCFCCLFFCRLFFAFLFIDYKGLRLALGGL